MRGGVVVMENGPFKVVANYSRVPAAFEVRSLPLEKPEFELLRQSGVSYIAYVHSPMDCLLRRGGASESFHFDLFFLVSGELRITTQEKSFQCCAGQLALIPSWLDRELENSVEISYLYARFDNPGSYPQVREIVVVDSWEIPELLEYFQRLYEPPPQLASTRGYATYLAGLIHVLFQNFLRPSGGADAETAARMMHYLHQSSCYSVTVLGRKFGLSLSSLRKFCLENFDKPPAGVINDVRMTKARGLLRYGDADLEEIARELGFANRFSFSKAFTRYHRIPPVRYRTELPEA